MEQNVAPEKAEPVTLSPKEKRELLRKNLKVEKAPKWVGLGGSKLECPPGVSIKHRKSLHISTASITALLDPGDLQVPQSPGGTQGSSKSRATIVPIIERNELAFQEEYELKEMLGQGSTAVVKRCVKKSTGEHFAVKIVRTSDEEVVRIIQQEFKIMSELASHPNLLRVYALFNDGQQLQTVMELVEGDELATVIQKEGPLSETVCRKYFKQILRAIHHLHIHSVVHRDITPFNIMLRKDGVIKVTDFNVSKHCGKPKGGQFNGFNPVNFALHTSTGTPSFNAPQIIRGDFYYSEVVDEWSAGCVLYMMITGHQPFYSDNLAELVHMIEMGKFDMSGLEQANIEMTDLLRRLLQVKLSKRMTALEALKSPWFDEGIAFFEQEDSSPAAATATAAAGGSSTHSLL